jgi:hypothetical protein
MLASSDETFRPGRTAMNELLGTHSAMTSVSGDHCQGVLTAGSAMSEVSQIDAQVAYQIALARIRLHRNRWKASDSDQTGADQNVSGQCQAHDHDTQVVGNMIMLSR